MRTLLGFFYVLLSLHSALAFSSASQIQDAQNERGSAMLSITSEGAPTLDAQGKLRPLNYGILISKDGSVLTPSHVIDGIDSDHLVGRLVRLGSKPFRLVKLGTYNTGKPDELTLLRVEGGIPPGGDYLPLVANTGVAPSVLFLLSASPKWPAFLDASALTVRENRDDGIELSGSIYPGTSGGAVVDVNGSLFGIVTSGLPTGSLGYAYPMNSSVRAWMTELGAQLKTTPNRPNLVSVYLAVQNYNSSSSTSVAKNVKPLILQALRDLKSWLVPHLVIIDDDSNVYPLLRNAVGSAGSKNGILSQLNGILGNSAMASELRKEDFDKLTVIVLLIQDVGDGIYTIKAVPISLVTVENDGVFAQDVDESQLANVLDLSKYTPNRVRNDIIQILRTTKVVPPITQNGFFAADCIRGAEKLSFGNLLPSSVSDYIRDSFEKEKISSYRIRVTDTDCTSPVQDGEDSVRPVQLAEILLRAELFSVSHNKAIFRMFVGPSSDEDNTRTTMTTVSENVSGDDELDTLNRIAAKIGKKIVDNWDKIQARMDAN
jgi:hypothetical protein